MRGHDRNDDNVLRRRTHGVDARSCERIVRETKGRLHPRYGEILRSVPFAYRTSEERDEMNDDTLKKMELFVEGFIDWTLDGMNDDHCKCEGERRSCEYCEFVSAAQRGQTVVLERLAKESKKVEIPF